MYKKKHLKQFLRKNTFADNAEGEKIKYLFYFIFFLKAYLAGFTLCIFYLFSEINQIRLRQLCYQANDYCSFPI